MLASPRLTPEQYLEVEREAECKSEYFQGQMFTLPRGSYRHGHLIGNLVWALGNALHERPCIVTPTDVRLRVSPDGLYTYPDVMVVCGAAAFSDEHQDTLLNPVLIVEVLSPSTEAHDRGFKFTQYRRLESLREYVLVAQHEPRVERFLRQPGETWLMAESVGLGAVCRLESVDAEVSLGNIYDKVEFAAT